ncbi:hypothetical protein [Spirosoma areae]
MTLSIGNLPDEQRTTVNFADYRMDDDAFYDRDGGPFLPSE